MPVRSRRPGGRRSRLRRVLPLVLLFFILPPLFTLLLRRANSLGRRCMPPAADRFLHVPGPRLNLAIVTLSDESAGASPGRSFRGVLAASTRNKRAYAAAHGYGLAVLPTTAIDTRRPPSWSKILALRAHLHRHHWLFWNDADTLVTNPAIPLERILLSVIGHSDFDESPDLILTEDFNGVNAGVFFVRRSAWTECFLDRWWNHTSFIQFGSTKSGDNAALKHLIEQLSPDEMKVHIRIAKMQCLFNSYPSMPTWKSIQRLIFHLPTTWNGVYSDGDFMVHFAGLNDKQGWANLILTEIQTQDEKYKVVRTL